MQLGAVVSGPPVCVCVPPARFFEAHCKPAGGTVSSHRSAVGVARPSTPVRAERERGPPNRKQPLHAAREQPATATATAYLSALSCACFRISASDHDTNQPHAGLRASPACTQERTHAHTQEKGEAGRANGGGGRTHVSKDARQNVLQRTACMQCDALRGGSMRQMQRAARQRVVQQPAGQPSTPPPGMIPACLDE